MRLHDHVKAAGADPAPEGRYTCGDCGKHHQLGDVAVILEPGEAVVLQCYECGFKVTRAARLRPRKKPILWDHIHAVDEMLTPGLSQAEIARRLDVDPHRISDWVLKRAEWMKPFANGKDAA